MEILNPEVSLETFFALLRRTPNRLLMLDFDGTLAPFHPERMAARPYPGVAERLEAIIEGGKSRVMIISGRTIADLKKLLSLKRLPELWGCHGAEHQLPGGEVEIAGISDNARETLEAAREWSERLGIGDNVEVKAASVAFHWRSLPQGEAAKLKQAVQEEWSKVAESAEVALHEFDGGLELRVIGIDKGGVVREVVTKMSDDSLAAYLGDDRTDEDAFEMLAGQGLSVLVRPDLRPTVADFWIKPPEELVWFLDRWLEYAQSP